MNRPSRMHRVHGHDRAPARSRFVWLALGWGNLLTACAGTPCTVTRAPSWDHPFVVDLKRAADEFSALTAVDVLRQSHGALEVTLSSANTFSYERRQMSVAEYLDTQTDSELAERWVGATHGADGLFTWFGEHSAEWAPLLERYDYAPLLAMLPSSGGHGEYGQRKPALSFGVGSHMSGVPFHQHGPGFSETLHGAKRWLLCPGTPPHFMPNATAAFWLTEVLPRLDAVERASSQIVECTVGPGEAIFFPDGWFHATVNTPGAGELAVFVSTFL